MTLKEAIETLLDESIEDHVYTVRDRAMQELRDAADRGAFVVFPKSSWDCGRVKRFSEAINVLAKEVGRK